MRVIWSQNAIKNLDELQAYIASDSEKNVALVMQRIQQSCALLEHTPRMGRPGRVAGTLEWLVPRTGFLLMYEIRSSTVMILSVQRGARTWPKVKP